MQVKRTLLITLIMLSTAFSCEQSSSNLSNEKQKVDAILAGDWNGLRNLTSDALVTRNPVDMFLYLRSCMETNSSYYIEINSYDIDKLREEHKLIYDWLSKRHATNQGNIYLATLVAVAGYESFDLSPDGAIALLDSVKNKDSTHVMAYIESTEIRVFMQYLEDAKADFTKALELGDSLCYLHIMKSAFELADYELALEYLEPCLLINPNHAGGLAEKATLLRYLNRKDEAIPLFERATIQEPWSMELKLRLAYAYEEAGRLSEALSLYNEIRASAEPLYTSIREAASVAIDSITNKLSKEQ